MDCAVCPELVNLPRFPVELRPGQEAVGGEAGNQAMDMVSQLLRSIAARGAFGSGDGRQCIEHERQIETMAGA